MITFKKLKLKNFLSFGNNETEINLEDHKLQLVTGYNGSGKSSLIVEGLTFALFGQAYRDIKKSQLINFVNDKNCVVELDFKIDSDEYKLIRGQKPNILQLFKNNDLVPEASSSKDFQNYIETEILRMNIVSFKQLVVLGTANFIPFMQLSTPQRRKLVDDLLDVSIFTSMDQLNKGCIKELNQQMQENTIRLSSLKSELQAYKLLQQEQQKNMFTNSEIVESELIEKRNTAKHLKVKIDLLNQEISSLISLIEKDNPKEVIDKLHQAKSFLEHQYKTQTQNLQKTREQEHCPSCQQKIEEQHKCLVINSISQEIQVTENKVKRIEFKISQLLPEYENVLKRQKELSNKNLELSQLNAEFSLLISDIKRLQDQLNQEKVQEQNNDVSQKITELQNIISELEEKQANDFNEKYLRTVLSSMLVDSGIKSLVIKKFIPVINKKINQYLKTLGADYMFFLDQEFNEQIKGSGREKASYYSFSQGEKSRVDLALMFTWREIAQIVSGTKINVLVLDEVFDSAVDNTGMEGIKKILESIDSNVFIISHREQNSDDYNRHIQVKKQGRFSIISETIND